MVYNKKIVSGFELTQGLQISTLIPGHTNNDYIKLINVYEGALKTMRTMLEIFDAEFQTQHAHNPIHHMESRIKTLSSILGKLERKNLEPTIPNIVEHITDVVGLRIICPYIDDIYHLTDLLCNQKTLIVTRKSDYIKNPKRNGYRSMHLVVKVPVNLSDHVDHVAVEIQLRTIAMDMWASLEHELHYKSSFQPVEHLTERLRRCAVSLADIDLRMQEIYDHLNEKEDFLEE